jgi:hypothetical protein
VYLGEKKLKIEVSFFLSLLLPNTLLFSLDALDLVVLVFSRIGDALEVEEVEYEEMGGILERGMWSFTTESMSIAGCILLGG